MGGVHGVEVNVHSHASGTPDAGHEHDFVLGIAQAVHAAYERPEHDAVSAPCAIDMGETFVKVMNNLLFASHPLT